jgi:MoxR-like ATPase
LSKDPRGGARYAPLTGVGASLSDELLIATLAKHHTFILGLPGTGKSDMIREIVSRFVGASYCENLLSKTRPDAAILGPYNLPELRDKGDFHRKINGFLPTDSRVIIGQKVTNRGEA